MTRDFHRPGRSPVIALNGMVATSHPLAAKVGVQMLESGGNAMDAAIAVAVLLGLCEPPMAGIGGDLFALFTDGGQVRALNGSGRAPMAINPDRLRANGPVMPLRGPDAVTIPGAIDAFCRLNTDHGRLSLAQVLAPAIRYAEQGVPVAPRVAFDWADDEKDLTGVARDHFLLNGRAPRTGQIFRAPGQADVLRRVARDGRAGFYEGEVAADMVDSLRGLGGCHTLDDFAATASSYGDPVQTDYRGTGVLEHPPNGQGATALLLLNILSHFDIAGMDPTGADRAHIEAEATKLAYDARDRILADSDQTVRLPFMLSPDTAARMAALIDPNRAQPAARPAVHAMHRDTVYVSVVDRDRMAVSLIYSIFWGFGAGIASNRFGINFQNRGAGFNLTPGHPNVAGPGKRPMHTIIPGMMAHDGRHSPFGVMGGAYQPTGHARLVSNLTDHRMDVQAAIDLPRCFADETGLKVERGYPAATCAVLADRGHQITVPDEPLGGAQAIVVDDRGTLTGGSDPRKDGCALGY